VAGSDRSGYHWFQLSYILFSLLIFFTAVNIFEIPHGALGMEMTTDYHERTRLFSAKSFVGNLFAMSTPGFLLLQAWKFLKEQGVMKRWYAIRFFDDCCFLIPLSVWWFTVLREPGFVKAAKHKKTPFWKT